MKKEFFAIILAGLLLLAASGCVQATQEQEAGQQAETFNLSVKYFDESGAVVLDETISVEAGANAFEAMRENIEVDYEMSSYGAFVKGLGGVATPDNHYLALYVNGEYASKGIGDYTVDEDMLLEWKAESIESFGA